LISFRYHIFTIVAIFSASSPTIAPASRT